MVPRSSDPVSSEAALCGRGERDPDSPRRLAGPISNLAPFYEAADAARQMQALALRLLGYGPRESAHSIVAEGLLWRLRAYAGPGDGPPVLIVSAPIKRPYIWDLAPRASAVRLCVQHGFKVFLLEWKTPTAASADCGVAAYADEAISQAVDAMRQAAGGGEFFLVGHSLGGTLAAIYAGLHPEHLAGLVLLSAPLSFAPGVSRFRDALVAMAPGWLPQVDIIPGSLLSQLSAAAAPQSFVWSRITDAAQSAGDLHAADVRIRIEQWSLNETALSGRLVHEIFRWLFRENRLCNGKLAIEEHIVTPSALRLPVLAAANTGDDIAPPGSMAPFVEVMPGADKRLIEFPAEAGVVLQHLCVLVGRHALASVWPEIIGWMKERRPGGGGPTPGSARNDPGAPPHSHGALAAFRPPGIQGER